MKLASIHYQYNILQMENLKTENPEWTEKWIQIQNKEIFYQHFLKGKSKKEILWLHPYKMYTYPLVEATTRVEVIWVAPVLELETAGAVEVEVLTPTEPDSQWTINLRFGTFFQTERKDKFTRMTTENFSSVK